MTTAIFAAPQSSATVGPMVWLQQRPKIAAAAALVLTQTLLGVWPVVGTVVLREMPPKVLVGARILLAAPILILVTRPWRAGMPRRDIWAVLGLGVLGVVLNQAAFVEGLYRSTPLNGAVIGCLVPAWTLLIATLLGHERPRAQQLLGIALAMAGALGMVAVEQFEFGRERLIGNLLLLTSGVLYGGYLALARPLLARHGPSPVMGWLFVGASVASLPYVLPGVLAQDWQALSGAAWGGLAYVVLGATVIGYWVNSFALSKVAASSTAVFAYLQPFITGIAAGQVLDQRPGWHVVAAGALIFAGIGLVFAGNLLRAARGR